MTGKTWFTIRAAASKGSAEIDIYDEIGAWGIRAADFIKDLRALGEVKNLTLNINSPGGQVFDGLAIYNTLKRHPANITVRIDGIAASIASVIAMAGDRVEMPENAFMMIHDPEGFVLGGADDMRELAEVLDRIKGSIVSAYRDKSGKAEAEIAELMAAETWLTAAQAVEMGFADEMTKPRKIAACGDLSGFTNVPAALAGMAARSQSAQSVAKEIALTDAAANAGALPPAAQNIVDLDKARADAKGEGRAEALAYVNEVNDLCALAGKAGLAQGFIAKGANVEDIRAELLKARADKADENPVDPHHGGGKGDGSANNFGWDNIMAKASAHRRPAARQ